MPKVTVIQQIRPAGDDHQVVTITGGDHNYRREPCSDCPWKVASNGLFPAQAFRHSAETAYDMSMHSFGCHQSGHTRPATCAGFLLRGADNNLSVRLGFMTGRYKNDFDDGGQPLHANYREMAIANGVHDHEPILAPCR